MGNPNSSFQIIELMPYKIWELAAIKNYMRIDADYDDDLIMSLLDAAIMAAENFTKLRIIARRVKFICNIQHKQNFHLKYYPVKELVKIALIAEKQEVELQSHQYYLDPENSILTLDSKLQNMELRLEYIAGFLDQDIPKSIKHGILLHVTEMYDREGQSNVALSQEVKNLYLPYRYLRI